jgi:hypothetical protein
LVHFYFSISSILSLSLFLSFSFLSLSSIYLSIYRYLSQMYRTLYFCATKAGVSMFRLFCFVQEKQAGRTKDKRVIDVAGEPEEEESDDVVLTYKDEFGREMTKKEAFREISYKFHGRRPGKKKQEQRLIRYYKELEQSRQQADPTKNSTLLRALETHQQRTGQAFVVIQVCNLRCSYFS